MPKLLAVVIMSRNGEGKIRIISLPPDVVLHICTYCDLPTLGKLSQVCRFFRDITARDCLWMKRSRRALVTNQLTDHIKIRSYEILSAKEKCQVSFYWKNAKYREDLLIHFRTRYMPWLELQSNRLWVSKGKSIECFYRTRSGCLNQRCSHVFNGHTDDVCRFRYHNGYVVSGGRDSRICVWSADEYQLVATRKQCHQGDVNCVDVKGSIVISGSHDKSIKVWSLQNNNLNHSRTVQINDRVWSVAINPDSRFLYFISIKI